MSKMDRSLNGLPDAVRTYLLRYANENGIRPDDHEWIMLGIIAQSLRLPGDVRQATAEMQNVLTGAKAAAEATKAAAAAEVAASVAAQFGSLAVQFQDAVDNYIAQARQSVVASEWLKGVAMVTVVAALALGAVGSFAWRQGRQAGEIAGYARAADEKAAMDWAATPDGRGAYHLWQAGSLTHIVRCDLPGWKIEDRVCHPFAGADGQYGWRVP